MRPLATLTASLSLTASALAAAPTPVPAAPAAVDATAKAIPPIEPQSGGEPQPLKVARLPSFAATLANAPPIVNAKGWPVVSDPDAWKAIARSTERSRQSARWRYARSLIGKGHAPEAFGVLTAMGEDDPDLALVPAFRLALGATLVELGRFPEALGALSAEQLARNPEACAWRMRALAGSAIASDALQQLPCARAAITSRTGRSRTEFILTAAQAALEAGQPARALALVEAMPQADPAANLIRGRALFRLGKIQGGKLRLNQAKDNGSPEQRVDARIALIEGLAARDQLKPRKAYVELERLSYIWRGGPIERRGLTLRLKLATAMNDDQAMLKSGAALFRYHPAAQDSAALLGELQDRLRSILAPDSKLPLPDAAGLFWEYRDLSPAGAGGDFLVSQLADRLQGARLYDRAAELLDYQLTARAKDVAQGPLSVRVAELYILDGRPEKALSALRKSDDNLYPEDIMWDRLRIQAVTLHQLGRTDEALAVLDGVPDGAAIRDEIEWSRRNWRAVANSGRLLPPQPGQLSEVEQTAVLRRAVALAMLGREAALAQLRERYASAFATLPTAAAFDLLTGPIDQLDAAAIARAMAAMPAASPAGDIADLLTDAAQAAPKAAAKPAPKPASTPEPRKT